MKDKLFFKHFRLFLSLIAAFSIILAAGVSYGEEEENCILCHRHNGLRIIDEDGKTKSFFVDYENYKKSTHNKANCRGCHTSVTEIPHKKSDKKVNCGIMCHLRGGVYTKAFSHSKTYDSFMISAHGVASEDTPDCLYCHPKNVSKEKAKKERLDILTECSKCHMDDEKMAKYGIESGIIKSYRDSVHSKVFFLEAESGAICSDCHSVHNVSSKEIETSPINEKNLYKTCAGSETQIRGCHLATNPDFIFSFDHEKNKEAGILTGLKLKSYIDLMIIGVFYLFCIINIMRIIRG